MNRDELIDRITQAGFPYSSDTLAKLDCFEKLLESPRAYYAEGYKQGAAAEREACAKVCAEKAEEWFEMRGWLDDFANEIGSAIRARGSNV